MRVHSSNTIAARRGRGFTMIEMVIVIVILGILVAVAAPRFSDIGSSAHRAVVAGVGGGFREAVTQVHVAWLVSGYAGPGVNDNVRNFGAGNVDVNTAGWPTDTANGNTINSHARCVNVWNGILDARPTISQITQTTQNTDFKATRSGQNCTYSYTRDSVTRSFTYNSTNGRVTFSNP